MYFEMNQKKYCCTCKWYAEFEGVCCNADSKWTADFRCLGDSCSEWTSKEEQFIKREDLKNWTREQMELKIISLSSGKDILTKEIERMGRLIGNYESKIKELEKDNAAYSRANDLYKENIDDCEKKNDYLCNLRNELEAENKALKQRIKDSEDVCDGSFFSDEEDERDKLIAELQDQRQQDCIKINQLHVTIDTLVDKYSRLRKTVRME